MSHWLTRWELFLCPDSFSKPAKISYFFFSSWTKLYLGDRAHVFTVVAASPVPLPSQKSCNFCVPSANNWDPWIQSSWHPKQSFLLYPIHLKYTLVLAHRSVCPQSFLIPKSNFDLWCKTTNMSSPGFFSVRTLGPQKYKSIHRPAPSTTILSSSSSPVLIPPRFSVSLCACVCVTLDANCSSKRSTAIKQESERHREREADEEEQEK